MEICQLHQDRLQLAATERRSQPNKDHSWRQQLTNWQRLWNDNRKSVNDQAPANQYNINTRWKVLGNGLKGFLPRHADETTRVFAYKIEQLPGKPNQTLKIQEKVEDQGVVFIKCVRKMYGLLHAGITAQTLLEERLENHGYCQSDKMPGLWKHNSRPISFTLIVDDFGNKYIDKKHAKHIINVLKKHYTVEEE